MVLKKGFYESNMKVKKEDDKQDCFARLSERMCNALTEKKCQNCSFYKHYSEVKNYHQYLPKGYTRKKKPVDKS